MINESFFLGYPEKLKSDIYVFPPTVKDIITNKEFPLYKELFIISQEEIEDKYIEQKIKTEIPTPIEYLMSYIFTNEKIRSLVSRGFAMFLHEPVLFIPKRKLIVVGDLQAQLSKISDIAQLRTITEQDYFKLQNLMREAIGEKPVLPPNPKEHPKIKMMKAKARYRDRIKAKTGKGLSLGGSLAALCCMGIGITPLNIGELSYAAVKTLMQFFQEREKYDIDVRSLLAGAKAKDVNLKYWIRDLDD